MRSVAVAVLLGVVLLTAVGCGQATLQRKTSQNKGTHSVSLSSTGPVVDSTAAEQACMQHVDSQETLLAAYDAQFGTVAAWYQARFGRPYSGPSGQPYVANSTAPMFVCYIESNDFPIPYPPGDTHIMTRELLLIAPDGSYSQQYGDDTSMSITRPSTS